MPDLIQLARGTAAEWASADPVLKTGEPGFETDTKILRIGDGTTKFTGLAALRNVTNLSVSTGSGKVTVVSDTGQDAELPAATTSKAGVMSAADKTKLDGFGSGGAFAGFCAIQTSAQSVDSSTVTMNLDSVSGSDDAFNQGIDIGDLLADNYFTVPAALDGKFVEFTAGSRSTSNLGQYFLRIERSTDGGNNWSFVAVDGKDDEFFGYVNASTGPRKLSSGDLWRVKLGSSTTGDTAGDHACFFAMTVLGG